MKGFYALASAIAVGSMMTVSAMGPKATTFMQPKSPALINKEFVGVQTAKVQKAPQLKASRAEDADITKINQMTYGSYFDVFDVSTGQAIQKDGAAPSAVEVSYDVVGDKIYMSNFMGFSMFEPIEVTIEDGAIYLELGQVLVVSGGYTYILAAIGDDLYTEGALPLLWTEDHTGFGSNDFYIGAIATTTGANGQLETHGWAGIAMSPIWCTPNATIEFDQLDDDGLAVENHVSNRIFVSYEPEGYQEETAQGVMVCDRFSLSSLMATNNYPGFMVSFLYIDGYAVTEETLPWGAPSGYTKDDGETGTFFVVSFYGDREAEEESLAAGLEGNVNDDMTVLTFPYNYPDAEIVYTDWTLWAQETGYWYGYNAPATVTFDRPLPDINWAGVESVNVDNSQNGPAEYYNLQGVKVANPEAGHIYIVKQGSKVSKRAIR